MSCHCEACWNSSSGKNTPKSIRKQKFFNGSQWFVYELYLHHDKHLWSSEFQWRKPAKSHKNRQHLAGPWSVRADIIKRKRRRTWRNERERGRVSDWGRKSVPKAMKLRQLITLWYNFVSWFNFIATNFMSAFFRYDDTTSYISTTFKLFWNRCVGIPQRMDDVKEYSVSELRTVVVAIIPHLMDFCGTVHVLQCSSKWDFLFGYFTGVKIHLIGLKYANSRLIIKYYRLEVHG